ncbi:hypothetical protein K2173_001818 [Erythroxylum novogranatense]|uniref:Patellin-4 n=1 Tax=Erythroxylum novogranatense TaxID=1862640 RepID=A0AAV8SIV0_9ROSI|nr:hypothetical protein K2173_001818 [Erythroxylum novogranatense]
MTVEVKTEQAQVAEVVIPQDDPKKAVMESEKIVNNGVGEVKEVCDDLEPKTIQKSSSYKEESNFLSDLKDHEKKALDELKSQLEEAILGNDLLEKEEPKKNDKKPVVENEKDEGDDIKLQEVSDKQNEETERSDEAKPEEVEKEKATQECQEENKREESTVEGNVEPKVVVDKDISLWGIPLLPSKGADGTDVILLKFLRAREFKVNEAFEMLKKTLQWRKESNVDSIINENLEVDLSSAFYMDGVDREGHPVCYNVYGAFANEELYSKALGTKESRAKFLRWRFQLMEKGIQKLDLKPGGVSSLLQISDLKNSPSPSKKELRVAMNKAVELLQDNYPEFVARNIFINVPFWYYALNALLSPFLTQRTKSKFVVARPAKVTETLLKYIPAGEIPVQYGGFKRTRDFEFSIEDGEVSEFDIKAGSTETIEIPAAEVGTTLLWDLSVVGWEVHYKEEFVPTDEGSYTIIIQKGKKMVSSDESIRNTFKNNEPGKVVLTIENTSNKKKRALYRYKTKKAVA